MSSTATTRTTTRRPPLKWHPPPPPTPRILHFPRRHRRKPQPIKPAGKPILGELRRSQKTNKLEVLFDEERSFSRGDDVLPIVLLDSGGGGCETERRERVVEKAEEDDCEFLERERDYVVLVDERERERLVEVEMLRAECKFLRMEREVALKKLERNRVRMEKTLRSAVRTLLSGRKKIGEGKSVSMVLEEEIEDLEDKLMELQRSSGHKDFELRSCSNFDKQVLLLQRRLEKLGGTSDDKCVKEIREMAEASLSINSTCKVDGSFGSNRKCSKFTDADANSRIDDNFSSNDKCSEFKDINPHVQLSMATTLERLYQNLIPHRMEVLRRKMEGLSKGMLLERMEEEYGSMLSTANSSVASSASNSRRIEYPDSCTTTSLRQPCQETVSREENRCKAIVWRIVEQVRAETEQWSQMQEMLGQVREEMEELQASRDFWENRALDSDFQIQSLHSAVQEWEQKSLNSETKANELQAQLHALQVELERTRMDQLRLVSRARKQPPPPISLDEQNEKEKEKRVLICRLKENHHISSGSSSKRNGLMAQKRPPFQDIGNSSSSPLVRQISRAIFPSHCPRHSDEKAMRIRS